jgi:3-deoxy-manno-octulosonate cytidylyltransferase (CMP-KDO synthetase)
LSRIACIIPARYASSRFPGKPLADLGGKPIIAHVVERALESGIAHVVAVATDDLRIAAAAEAAGAQPIMTGETRSGSDRVAKAATKLSPHPDWVINIQGDEPMLSSEVLVTLAGAMRAAAATNTNPYGGATHPRMFTLARPLEEDELELPQVVKVVCDQNGDALYFSRAPIPYQMGGQMSPGRAHVGVYGFTATFLQEFAALPPGKLEAAESLEQLRALEHGHRIRVVDCEYAGFGIDTPEDLEKARKMLERGDLPW